MKIEKAIFACGCFWGVQHQMERAKGVVSLRDTRPGTDRRTRS